PSGMHMCSYAFTQNGFDNIDIVNIRTPIFHTWQQNLLHLYFIGQLCAVLCLIAYCFSQTKSLEKAASFVFTIFAASAALVCCGSSVAFAIFSYMVEYRFLQVSVSGIYEKHRGYSFYVALCGSLLYIIALCFSLSYTVHVLRKDRYVSGSIDLERPMVGEQSYHGCGVPQFSQEDYFAMRSLPGVPNR
ncbi:Clc-like protein, partial [Dictyocaulus viviparus]